MIFGDVAGEEATGVLERRPGGPPPSSKNFKNFFPRDRPQKRMVARGDLGRSEGGKGQAEKGKASGPPGVVCTAGELDPEPVFWKKGKGLVLRFLDFPRAHGAPGRGGGRGVFALFRKVPGALGIGAPRF